MKTIRLLYPDYVSGAGFRHFPAKQNPLNRVIAVFFCQIFLILVLYVLYFCAIIVLRCMFYEALLR